MLFLSALVGQAFTGWKEYNDELKDKYAGEIGFAAYLHTGHFVSATFENFQSEFLQMALYVVLTVGLRQQGSAESKSLNEKEEVDWEPVAQFATLELNVTFYRFPQLSVLRAWHDQAPEDFCFSVKAPKAITHFKQFHGTMDMLTDFYGTIREGLADKLGPVLFQFPPRFHYAPERLARVLDQLDPGFDNVLEFRHPGWWREEVYNILRQKGIAFCGMSHPELPAEPIITGPVVYYRFHGVPELYRSAYSEAELAAIAGKIGVAPGVREVWCYFNNDAAVAAIPNAHTLIRLTSAWYESILIFKKQRFQIACYSYNKLNI